MPKKNIIQQIFAGKPSSEEKIINKATRQAKRTIGKAVVKAEQILGETDLFNDLLKKELQNELHAAVLKNSELFTSEMKQAAVETLNKFQETLEAQLAASQKILSEAASQEYAAAKEEIKKYKTEKIAAIDAAVGQQVDKLAIEILGESIPINFQNQIITRILEKAKKEGVFE